MMKFKTPGRDLYTESADIVAEEGMVIDPDKFHVASIRFPAGVSEVKLRSADTTPEQGIRTITVEHDADGLQRQVSIYNPASGQYRVFNVYDKTIIALGLIRYKGANFYYRIEYEQI